MPEFQNIATSGIDSIVVDLYDPIGRDRGKPQPPTSGTRILQPSGASQTQGTHTIQSAGAGQLQAPILPSVVHQNTTHHQSGAYQTYNNPKPGADQATANVPASPAYPSLDLFEETYGEKKSRGAALRDMKTFEVKYEEGSEAGSEDTQEVQQSLLAIVDGLHRLGETLCNNSREQQRTQERFFQSQQKFFESMEDRNKERAMEERCRQQELYNQEKKRALEERRKHQELFDQERERQEAFYKQMSDILTKVKAATTSESGAATAKGLESVVTAQIESVLSKQLEPVLSEVRSVISQRTESESPKEDPFSGHNQAYHESDDAPFNDLHHVYPADGIYVSSSHRDTSTNRGRSRSRRRSANSAANAPSLSCLRTSRSLASNDTQGPRKLQTNLIENFEGNAMVWQGWKKNFSFVAEACAWTDAEKLLMLRTHLRGSAMTVVQNLSEEVLGDHQAIMDALDARYGSTKPSTKNRLRAELQAIKQLESENLETFADRVFALAVNAHPNYVREEDLQGYAVDAFLNGCKDKNAGLLANVVPPRTISDALDQVKAIQLSSARNGSKLVNRQVSFGDSTSITDRQHTSVSPMRCYTCDGNGHKSRDCANKRRRSPSPFRCYECQGRGHIAAECANRLRRPSSGDRRRDSNERYSRDSGHGDRQRYYSPGPRRDERHQDFRSPSSSRQFADSPGRSRSYHHGFSSSGSRDDDRSYRNRYSSPGRRDNYSSGRGDNFSSPGRQDSRSHSPRHHHNSRYDQRGNDRNEGNYGPPTSPNRASQGTTSGPGSSAEHQPRHHLNFQQ